MTWLSHFSTLRALVLLKIKNYQPIANDNENVSSTILILPSNLGSNSTNKSCILTILSHLFLQQLAICMEFFWLQCGSAPHIWLQWWLAVITKLMNLQSGVWIYQFLRYLIYSSFTKSFSFENAVSLAFLRIISCKRKQVFFCNANLDRIETFFRWEVKIF